MMPEEIKNVFKILDNALITALGASTSFAEEPPPGVTVAIIDPNRWDRTDNDHVLIKGNIWVIYGATDYLDARSRGMFLSSQMRKAEQACQSAFMTIPRHLMGKNISFTHMPNGSYGSWNLEISTKLENAHQEAPALVQIRPQFELGLVDPLY